MTKRCRILPPQLSVRKWLIKEVEFSVDGRWRKELDGVRRCQRLSVNEAGYSSDEVPPSLVMLSSIGQRRAEAHFIVRTYRRPLLFSDPCSCPLTVSRYLEELMERKMGWHGSLFKASSKDNLSKSITLRAIPTRYSDQDPIFASTSKRLYLLFLQYYSPVEWFPVPFLWCLNEDVSQKATSIQRFHITTHLVDLHLSHNFSTFVPVNLQNSTSTIFTIMPSFPLRGNTLTFVDEEEDNPAH